MIQKITIALIIFIVAFASLGYLSYTLWQAQQIVNNKTVDTVLSDAQISENFERLTQSLNTKAHVPFQKILQGFWYRYYDDQGREQIAFLDARKLSESELTQWKIKATE